MKEDIEENYDPFNYIKVISDTNRMKIMRMIDENRSVVSFKDISRLTGIPPTNLAYHIGILEKEGLVDKRYVNEKDRRDYTRYDLTAKGEMIFRFGDIMDLISKDRGKNRKKQTHLKENIHIIPEELGPRAIILRD